MEEYKSKMTTFFLTLVGIFIFFGVIMLKIDVAAQEAEAKIGILSTQMDWERYLDEKTIQQVMEKRKGNL